MNFTSLDFGQKSKKNMVVDYNFSQDEKKILIAVNPEYIYRHRVYIKIQNWMGQKSLLLFGV